MYFSGEQVHGSSLRSVENVAPVPREWTSNVTCLRHVHFSEAKTPEAQRYERRRRDGKIAPDGAKRNPG